MCNDKPGVSVEMTNNTIHVIDFEGNRKNGIREFGCVELVDFKIISTKTHFVDEKNQDDVLKYLYECRIHGTFAAHEAQTESILLRNLSPVVSLNKNLQWGPFIDSKKIYSALFKNMTKFSLKNLITQFDLLQSVNAFAEIYCPSDRKNFHCALYDAIAAAVLLQNINEIFHSKCVTITLEQLLVLSE